MSIPANPFADRAPPVAVPVWPGARHADLIQSRLRSLDEESRDALLHAVACAMDRYLATASRRNAGGTFELDAALDDVLRLLTPAKGTGPALPGLAADTADA